MAEITAAFCKELRENLVLVSWTPKSTCSRYRKAIELLREKVCQKLLKADRVAAEGLTVFM